MSIKQFKLMMKIVDTLWSKNTKVISNSHFNHNELEKFRNKSRNILWKILNFGIEKMISKDIENFKK